MSQDLDEQIFATSWDPTIYHSDFSNCKRLSWAKFRTGKTKEEEPKYITRSRQNWGTQELKSLLKNPLSMYECICICHCSPPALHGKLRLFSLCFPVLLNDKSHTSELLSLTQIEVKIFLEAHKSKSYTQTCNISLTILYNACIFLTTNLNVQNKTVLYCFRLRIYPPQKTWTSWNLSQIENKTCWWSFPSNLKVKIFEIFLLHFHFQIWGYNINMLKLSWTFHFNNHGYKFVCLVLSPWKIREDDYIYFSEKQLFIKHHTSMEKYFTKKIAPIYPNQSSHSFTNRKGKNKIKKLKN